MHSLLQDLRYALRGLRRGPGFTILAVLALALGIGSVTTIYSVIENVLLDPFPYKDANHIVSLQIHDMSRGERGGRGGFQIPEFLDWQQQNHVFDEVIGAGQEDVLYTNGEGTDRFRRRRHHAEHLPFLGRYAARRTWHFRR